MPTVRDYDVVGLMAAFACTESRQRSYDMHAVARLNFVRHARELGFEVEAILELLAMNAQPNRSCTEMDAITHRHLAEVDRRSAQLSAMRGELHRMSSECDHGRIGECRIIQVLADHGERACDHH